MLNNSNTIILSDGTTNKSIDAISVEFSHEQTLGKLEETVDGELVENYNGERLLIDTKFWADTSLANWLTTSFFSSTSKSIAIDGFIYNVVSTSNKNNIKLVKNKNFRGDVTLKFKKKELGVAGEAI